MRKRFYKWLFKTFYKRVCIVEQYYFRTGDISMSNVCIKLQNLMNFLKDELTGETEV